MLKNLADQVTSQYFCLLFAYLLVCGWGKIGHHGRAEHRVEGLDGQQHSGAQRARAARAEGAARGRHQAAARASPLRAPEERQQVQPEQTARRRLLHRLRVKHPHSKKRSGQLWSEMPFISLKEYR